VASASVLLVVSVVVEEEELPQPLSIPTSNRRASRREMVFFMRVFLSFVFLTL
jgi:hypothetical protein